MEITREMLIKKVAEESGYYQKNIRDVFNVLEDVLVECFNEIDDDEPISIRIIQGLSLSGYVVPERERVNPRNRKPIVCKPTIRINARCSEGFKEKVQKIYDDKKEG